MSESEDEEEPEGLVILEFGAAIQLPKMWDQLPERAQHGDSDQEDHQPEDWKVPEPAAGDVTPPSIQMAREHCGGPPDWSRCSNNVDAAMADIYIGKETHKCLLFFKRQDRNNKELHLPLNQTNILKDYFTYTTIHI